MVNGKPKFLKKKPIPKEIIITGMICLTIAELYALHNGINGTIFTMYVAAIAAAIGVFIPNPNIK